MQIFLANFESYESFNDKNIEIYDLDVRGVNSNQQKTG